MYGYNKGTVATPKLLSEELKAQVLNLLDDLLEIFPEDFSMLAARLFFSDKVEAEPLMKGFVKYVLPWKEQIIGRQENYFDKNEYIFGDIDSDQVEHFRKLYKSPRFTPDDKKVVWDYFQIYLVLAEKYKKII